MVDCAKCKKKFCADGRPCPVGLEMKNSVLTEYEKRENARLYQRAGMVEATGYMEYPRMRELIELAKLMGWERIGMAFCIGLSEEAIKIEEILRSHGFEVHSVICKVGGIRKENLGLRQKNDEVACNPILQAKVLNQVQTNINVLVGLCLGHDILFQRYSKAPTTTLVVKDRVLAHNPLGAIYSRYYRNRLMGREGER